MTVSADTDPWDDSPDGRMHPFITVKERDSLINNRSRVLITDVRVEGTKWGDKWYVDMAIPPNDDMRTGTIRCGTDDAPRDRLLRHFNRWLRANTGRQIPAILVADGRGWMLARPEPD